MNKEPNLLIHSSSPYLLQHAYNPVNWQEWGDAALEEARRDNKLILVSIGYSACHWCHVMEHESFEDYEVADIMNTHFVCIKIDREERPDIDHIYMMAVQLMGINGGWPLNCICLPDQRPIYGGTYFRKNDWINILLNVANLYKNEPQTALAYADRITEGIRSAELILPKLEVADFNIDQIKSMVEVWKRNLDMHFGGYTRAPKFPLPNNWQFLLQAGFHLNDEALTTATLFTLEKMALGGIYDQIGGGFARYSVDEYWHVPHFEKMLYDNAQLIRVYAQAWQFSQLPLFKEVVYDTVDWLKREMLSPTGLFYSALDADSEGVEGKFYVWTKSEFDEVVGEDAVLIGKYFDVTESGNWEAEKVNILRVNVELEAFIYQNNLDASDFKSRLSIAKKKLFERRKSRIYPGLDDKCLTSWNALLITALAEASAIFDNAEFYKLAENAANYLVTSLKEETGILYRNKKGGIPGFLDDYAFLIEAFIQLYQVDFNEKWLLEADELVKFVSEHFNSNESPALFYTSDLDKALIARKFEVIDSVMPSSNSVMAQNYEKLGLLLDNNEYADRAIEMLKPMVSSILKYNGSYSNWALQLLNKVVGVNEIALTGNAIKENFKALNKYFIPNKIVIAGTNSNLPLLKDKDGTQSNIYICKNKTCSLPVETLDEALELIT